MATDSTMMNAARRHVALAKWNVLETGSTAFPRVLCSWKNILDPDRPGKRFYHVRVEVSRLK
jgi:hypothetical protein